jgi:teichuronic acid exporter
MLRSVATILRGNVLAQVIGIAVLPILSRNFPPEAFGNFQAFQAVVTFLLIFVTMRYEIAVLRADDGAQFAAVIKLCGILLIITTIFVSVALVIVKAVHWPHAIDNLQFPWWLLSLSMLVGGAAQLLGYVAVRGHHFAAASNSKVAQAVANTGVSGALALTSPISSGLIVGDLVGRLANAAWLTRKAGVDVRGALSPSFRQMRVVAYNFRDLSLLSLPGTLLSTAATSLTPLLIYSVFSSATAGQFGLTERTAGLPVALIVVAISQVHMAHLATDLRMGGDTARRNFKRISLLLTALAIVPTIALLIFAEQLYRFVLGPGWDQAALFAKLMAPSYLLGLVTGGINMTLTVVGHQKTQLLWSAARFVAMVGLWMVAPKVGWAPEWIVGFHSAILSVFSVIMLVLSYRALPDRTQLTHDEIGDEKVRVPVSHVKNIMNLSEPMQGSDV